MRAIVLDEVVSSPALGRRVFFAHRPGAFANLNPANPCDSARPAEV